LPEFIVEPLYSADKFTVEVPSFTVEPSDPSGPSSSAETNNGNGENQRTNFDVSKSTIYRLGLPILLVVMTANRETTTGIWKHMIGAGRGLRIVRPMVEDLMNEKNIEGEYSKNTQICLRRLEYFIVVF